MKPTENYEQLIERFTKRTAQLTARADELYDAYSEYVKIQERLSTLGWVTASSRIPSIW